MNLETTKLFLPPALRWPMTAVLAVTSALAFVEARTWPLFLLASLIALAAAVVATMCSWLQIDQHRVVLHLSPLYRRVLTRDDIVGLEIAARTSPMRYGGYGLRIWTGRTLALVTRTGPMLRVEAAPGSMIARYAISLGSDAEADQVREVLRQSPVPGA